MKSSLLLLCTFFFASVQAQVDLDGFEVYRPTVSSNTLMLDDRVELGVWDKGRKTGWYFRSGTTLSPRLGG